jgi:hypothetical protein
LAYRTLSGDARGLDIFSRYETRYDRQLSRAIQRFQTSFAPAAPEIV